MFFFFSSRRRHTRCSRDWSSDVCSSDLSASLAFRFVSDAERDRDLNSERTHLFDKKVYIMEAWTERNQGLLRTAHGLAWRRGNSRGPGTAQGNAEPGEAHSFHPGA